MSKYLIAHIGHTTKYSEHIIFWNPNSRGYTFCIEKAGRYDLAAATSICCTGLCIAVKPEEAKALARSTPFYRRSNGTLHKLYDGDRLTVVPNDKPSWKALMSTRLDLGKTERPTPMGARARAIYITEGGAA